MFLSDHEIAELCTGYEPMITPFTSKLVKEYAPQYEENPYSLISYGLSSYGYDIRLSPREFKIFQRVPGEIVDPKKFDDSFLVPSDIYYKDGIGAYFILPAHTYGLGVSIERFDIPKNVTGICLGKSTYARAGVIVNMTPLEAGWKGYLTIEISNSSDSDVRVYANEGIAQVLFSPGHACLTSYADRAGKYQNQPARIVNARI